MKRFASCCLLALLLGAAPPVLLPLAAQQQGGAAMDEYVPVAELPPDEQLPAVPLVLIAYGLIWTGVLVYVGLLGRRLTAVRKEMENLKQSLRS